MNGIWVAQDDDLPDVEPVSAGEGATPLVNAPRLADSYEVDELLFKDESRNPTGSIHDRAASVALSEARDQGVERVFCYAPGDTAVSVASYAGRAGVESHAYVPSRTRFDVKASVNVHGGSMKVVRGNLADARDVTEEDDGYSVSAGNNEYIRKGYKTAAHEIPDTKPDAVVCPVGSGEVYRGFAEGIPEDVSLHAAQPEGCAPLLGEVSTPDTVVGELEDPDPPCLDELRETAERRGSVVSVSDGEALDTCLDAAREGVSLSPSGGVALAALSELDASGTVVVLNPALGRLSADALRNRMVYHGE
jgi:threonine synthase